MLHSSDPETSRARVKYSIRAPGPDMSRPPLNIARGLSRGFYDVRVVRTEGEGFSLDDILLVRRRTLWLEPVYAALTTYLMSPACKRLEVTGFQPGDYYDMPAVPAPPFVAQNIGAPDRRESIVADGW